MCFVRAESQMWAASAKRQKNEGQDVRMSGCVKFRPRWSEAPSSFPTYYRFYKDDIPVLSTLLESTFATIDPRTTYQFYFMHFKLGQQQPITTLPMMLNSTHLDLVVQDESSIPAVSKVCMKLLLLVLVDRGSCFMHGFKYLKAKLM